MNKFNVKLSIDWENKIKENSWKCADHFPNNIIQFKYGTIIMITNPIVNVADDQPHGDCYREQLCFLHKMWIHENLSVPLRLNIFIINSPPYWRCVESWLWYYLLYKIFHQKNNNNSNTHHPFRVNAETRAVLKKKGHTEFDKENS